MQNSLVGNNVSVKLGSDSFRIGDIVFVKLGSDSFPKFGPLFGVFNGISSLVFSDVIVNLIDGRRVNYEIPTNDLGLFATTINQPGVKLTLTFPVPRKVFFRPNLAELESLGGNSVAKEDKVYGICNQNVEIQGLEHSVIHLASTHHQKLNYKRLLIATSRVVYVSDIVNPVRMKMLAENSPRSDETPEVKQDATMPELSFNLYQIAAYNTDDGTIYLDTQRVTARDEATAKIKATRKLDEAVVDNEHLRIVVTAL